MNKVAIGMLYLSILLITSCGGGGGGGDTPRILDTTPEAFSFEDKTDIELSTAVVSNSITVSGIDSAAKISIKDGEYSIDAGAFTSEDDAVHNGQTVLVRQTSSDQSETKTSNTLTIGGVSAVFSVTTQIMDTEPDNFSFTDESNTPLGVVISSKTITVWGIEAAAEISIEDGEYSIDAGDFTSAVGRVNNGQTVSVRQTSSDKLKKETSSILTIGGIIDAFSVTTQAIDTTPETFSFEAQTDIAFNAVISSNSITVSGIEAAAEISIEDGEYSIDAGPFTNAMGTVNNGQTVSVRHTSSGKSEEKTSSTLTIGGISAVFSVTTPIMDTEPDSFSFDAQTEILFDRVVSSNSITVSGINAATKISIDGGEYLIGEASPTNKFTSEEGTVNNGQTVSVRQTSSGESKTETSTELTIGGINAVFSVTTQIMDAEPEGFSFDAQDEIEFNTVVSSNIITVSGINVPVAISIEDGEYSIDAGEFTSEDGTISNSQTVSVRQTSAGKLKTETSIALTIGGIRAVFSVTTFVVDETNPKVTITDNQPNETSNAQEVTFYIGLSEALSEDIVPSNIIVTGGTPGTFTRLNDRQYTLLVAPYADTKAGTITVSILSDIFTDMSGNPNLASNEQTQLYDSKLPTLDSIVLDDTDTDTVFLVGDTSPVTFTFSEDVSDFVESDIDTPHGGTISNLASIDGGTVWTATYTPAVGIENTSNVISVAATKFKDLAGNDNELPQSSANYAIETAAPTVTITDDRGFSTSNGQKITFIMDLSEASSEDIVLANIIVDGGATETFTKVNATQYTVLVVPFANTQTGTMRVSILSDIFTDVAGNYNLASNEKTQSYDTKLPTLNSIVLTDTALLAGDTSLVTFTFNEGISDFSEDDIDAPNGTMSELLSFNGGKVWTAIFTPNVDTEDASNVLSVAANKFIDTSSNYNEASQSSANYTIDTTAPAVTSFSSTTAVDAAGNVLSTTVPNVNISADTEPDNFSFNAQTDIEFNTEVSSNSITVSGINAAAKISIEGGEYSIGGGEFTSEDGTINNGQTVLVRQTSSDQWGTETISTLTIGGVSRTFSVSTLADKIAPTVMVNFPTLAAFTDGDTVTVRGTATDQEGSGVANVLVNDVSVDSDDDFANWSIEVSLEPGLNSLTVTALDNSSNRNEQSDKLSIVSDAITFSRPISLAFDSDSDSDRMLVLDNGLKALIAVDLVSGERTIVSNDKTPENGDNALVSPSFLAFDSIRERALVVDRSLKAIIAVDLDNGERIIVSDNTTPDGDPAFSDPRDLILDDSQERALVVDVGLDALIAVNLESGERTIVSDNTTPDGDPAFDTPAYLALDSEDNNRVFISDSSFGLDRERSLISVDLSSGVRGLVTNTVESIGVLAFDSGKNRLLASGGLNGGPSLHFLDFGSGETSTVSSNTIPNGDNAFGLITDVVIDNDRALVLDGDLKAIIAVDLEDGTRSIEWIKGAIPYGGSNVFTAPVALTLDSTNNRALVLDSRLKAIIAVNLDNGERSIVSSSTIPNGENAFDLPTALALDSANKRALVLDDGLDALIAVKLEDGARSILSNNTMPDGDNAFDSIVDVVIDNDRALVLDSSLKALIAVDLDSGKRSIVSDSTTPLNGENAFDLPTALALDSDENRVLVLDDGLDALIAVNLDSGARSIVSDDTTPNKTNSFSRPSALVLDSANNRALVLDPGLNALIAVNLDNGARTIVSNITTLNGDNGFDSPMDLLLDSDNNRVLVVDRSLRAVIAVDLVSGFRVILSK